ncbi:MAG: hypothetical protein ACE5ER_11080, partial [Nitrospinaceae bacterium]
LSCVVCHTGFPQLNGFGEAFAGNGYQMPGVGPEGFLKDIGDDKLFLQERLPLAVRVDSFLRVRNDSDTQVDNESPFAMKLLSSAPLKKDISYYFYFLFNERGDVTGVEDAFLYFNDAFLDLDWDFRLGQFQVSDILFPREQRLTFQDYSYYVTRISDSGFNLTYDRSFESTLNLDLTDSLGLSLTGAVANGNGIGVGDAQRNFDSDNFKNFYGKISLSSGGHSLGIYGYSGREKNPATRRNEFFRVGPVFHIQVMDQLKLWGNFLYGEDDNPDFRAAAARKIQSWGGFAGMTYLTDSDWIFTFLYNLVEVKGLDQLDEQTITGNITYYISGDA